MDAFRRNQRTFRPKKSTTGSKVNSWSFREEHCFFFRSCVLQLCASNQSCRGVTWKFEQSVVFMLLSLFACSGGPAPEAHRCHSWQWQSERSCPSSSRRGPSGMAGCKQYVWLFTQSWLAVSFASVCACDVLPLPLMVITTGVDSFLRFVK